MPATKTQPSICFVSLLAYHFFNESKDGNPTGVGYQGLSIVALFLRSYFNVSIVTEDCGQRKKQIQNNITLYASINLKNKHFILNLYRFFQALHQANADIYIASVFGRDVFFTWLFCKMYRKKFVYLTAHDYECTRGNQKKYPLTEQLFTIALEHADIIITILHTHAQLLQTYHPAISCPIIHIPYAIPQEKQQPFNKKNYILWIARCAPIKNPLAFITIAAAFPTQQFVMIAAPQEGHMELFDAIKKAAGVHSNITLIPGVPNESAQRYFNEAVVSVNTSSSEGFPFAFLESGLGKTPIMSLTVNPDNLITTHNIGYCANGDIDLLIQQLQTILSNSDDLREKSNAAREYVRKYHDIRHTSQLWKDVLSSSLLGSDMK